ncbi:MAG: hypothetical protein ACLP9Y_21900 [Mycobacterium sp.]
MTSLTHGEDGKTYTRRMPRGPRPKAKPWQFDGVASKAIRKAHKMLRDHLPIGLDEWEKNAV